MSRYYSSDDLQTKSIGIFISVVFHLLLLGIILPRAGAGDGSFLKGKRQLRNIDLVALTREQQQQIPESVLPPPTAEPVVPATPDVLNTEPVRNNLPLSVNPDLETIPVPPPLNLPPPPPPPPSTGITASPSFQRASLFPLSPPPIPKELIEIINPPEDPFSMPKLIQPEIIPEPVIATVPTLKPEEREENLLASVQARAQLLKYDIKDTRPAEAQKNYQSWISWQENDNPQKIDWQGNYPLDGCVKKIEGTTVYGVLIDPEGKIVNLKLIQSAGYPLLNQEAAKEIEAFNFASASTIQPYVVTVKFAYNADLCPSLSISP